MATTPVPFKVQVRESYARPTTKHIAHCDIVDGQRVSEIIKGLVAWKASLPSRKNGKPHTWRSCLTLIEGSGSAFDRDNKRISKRALACHAYLGAFQQLAMGDDSRNYRLEFGILYASKIGTGAMIEYLVKTPQSQVKAEHFYALWDAAHAPRTRK